MTEIWAIVATLKKFVLILALLPVYMPLTVDAGDRSPSPFSQVPDRHPRPLVPEVQTDGFSCGYHALSAVYRSYGLNPHRAYLRARLGTSVPAIPFVSDSTGTLQPDLFRVLQQDGFSAIAVSPQSHKDRDHLIKHLQTGQYCLALLKTERAGGLHWIVFTGYDDGKLTVGDSLQRGLQEESLDELAEGSLLSAILLTPATPSPGSPYYGAHASGLGEMLVTSLRSLPLVISLPLLALIAFLGWKLLKAALFVRKRLWAGLFDKRLHGS